MLFLYEHSLFTDNNNKKKKQINSAKSNLLKQLISNFSRNGSSKYTVKYVRIKQ